MVDQLCFDCNQNPNEMITISYYYYNLFFRKIQYFVANTWPGVSPNWLWYILSPSNKKWKEKNMNPNKKEKIKLILRAIVIIALRFMIESLINEINRII